MSIRRTCSCAIGSPRDVAVAAIRMSLGSLTTAEQLDRVAQVFPKLVAKARRLAGAAN